MLSPSLPFLRTERCYGSDGSRSEGVDSVSSGYQTDTTITGALAGQKDKAKALYFGSIFSLARILEWDNKIDGWENILV